MTLLDALKSVRSALDTALATEYTPEELCATQSVEAAKEAWTYRLEDSRAAILQLVDGPQPPSAKAAGELARRWLDEPVLSAGQLHDAFEALARIAG